MHAPQPRARRRDTAGRGGRVPFRRWTSGPSLRSLLTDIETEMSAVIDERGGHARPLYEMLAYHLGLDGTRGPRGKRMRPLLGAARLRVARPATIARHSPAPRRSSSATTSASSTTTSRTPTASAAIGPRSGRVWGVPLAINAGDALFALSRLALYRLLERWLQRASRARPDADLRRDVPRAVRGAVPRHQLRAPGRRHRRGLPRDDRQEDGRAASAHRSRPARSWRPTTPTCIEAYRRFGYRPRHGLPDGR